MKELSLQRHAKSLAWQPVEPMAERAGLCWGGRRMMLAWFRACRNGSGEVGSRVGGAVGSPGRGRKVSAG